MRFFLFIVLAMTITEANNRLSDITKKANYSNPMETVSLALENTKDSKKYIYPTKEEVIYNKIKNIIFFDISKSKEYRICRYVNTKKTYDVFFEKTNNYQWKVITIFDEKKKKKRSSIINDLYNEEDAINCFPKFVNDWSKKYKNSPIALLSKLSRINNIEAQNNNKIETLTFNFEYRSPTGNNFKTGWLITDIKIKKSKKTRIQHKPLANKDKSFFLPKNNKSVTLVTDESGYGKRIEKNIISEPSNI